MSGGAAPLRGAIAGCGFFSQFHLDAWSRMGDVRIVAACDPDLARAQRAAPRAYASIDELLAGESELDFIDIATRPETHRELVERACARGIPVICQKPVAPTFADAEAIVETAARTGNRVMIHENWRWQPWYRELQRRVVGGDIGSPVTYRFRIRKRDGAGDQPYPAQPYFRDMPRLLIHETIVHPIDTARFLFGDLAGVTARIARRNPIIVGEDFAQVLTEHRSGLRGVIDGHRFTDLAPDSPPLGDAEVEGESGVLTVTATGDVLGNGRLVWANTVQTGYRGDSVLGTQRHFVDCLRSGAEFETSAAEYLKTVRAVEAAYRSAAGQCTVGIE